MIELVFLVLQVSCWPADCDPGDCEQSLILREGRAAKPLGTRVEARAKTKMR